MNARIKVVDCSDVRSERQFWAAYVHDVKPESSDFGHNLNAFWDALWGGPGWPDADVLRFIHTSAIAPLYDGQFLDSLKQMAQKIESIQLEFE